MWGKRNKPEYRLFWGKGYEKRQTSTEELIAIVRRWYERANNLSGLPLLDAVTTLSNDNGTISFESDIAVTPNKRYRVTVSEILQSDNIITLSNAQTDRKTDKPAKTGR